MDVQPDFRDLLELFNAHKVEYVVVGAYALAFHGAPRFTGDLDVLVRSGVRNGRRIVAALAEFGFASVGVTADDFKEAGKVVQLGVAPVRIDLVTSLTGVSWKEAAAGSRSGRYGDLRVRYLGKREFIRNKRAIGRTKDLADIEALGG
ncbi:hypothetical protein FJY68_06895 [candidate division WOR-3 bacterium]|uniref:Nucleotidyltransferase family protein n=1 Tax=candidate division WOR-3 bacterium TaxID=2052148 RepID=A0A937XD84_UNCW3|nr:hypothetical protein [candidate division WOR-3 bacterium]